MLTRLLNLAVGCVMSGLNPMGELPEAEAIDDTIEALQRNASLEDYPPPEGLMRDHRRGTPRVAGRSRPHHPFHAVYDDLRSLTRDASLDEEAVPGYRDMPVGLVVDFRR